MGEYPWDVQLDEGYLYFVYILLFGWFMYLIMLNFFLAIVVDSYAKIKRSVLNCVIDLSVYQEVICML